MRIDCFVHFDILHSYYLGKNYRMGKNYSAEAGRLQHDCLGVLHMQPNSNGGSARVLLKRQVESLKRFNEWDREIRTYLQQDFREVFYLPQDYRFVSESMCGTAGCVEMEFQYYKYSLKSEIASRHQSRVAFDETELWYLLYNLLEAAFLLQPLCRRIGDVHPRNIVINEKGRIKIIPQALFPNAKTSFQKIVEDITSDVFIAPEEIDEHAIDRGTYPPIDAIKAEAFSIGVTILMAACLRDSSHLYDRKVLKFSSVKKQQRMSEVSTSYSLYFCKLLGQMLEEDASKRRSSGQLFRQLNCYEDDILSLRKFQLMDPKMKQAFGNKEESYEPSIADILMQNERRGSHVIPNPQGSLSLLNNFHSF